MTGFLLLLGCLLVVVGGLWLLVEMFRTSVWWGIFCLLFAPLQFVFVILYWRQSWRPLLLQTLGFLLILGAALTSGDFRLERMRSDVVEYWQATVSGPPPAPVVTLDPPGSAGKGDTQPAATTQGEQAAVPTAGQAAPAAVQPPAGERAVYKCKDKHGVVTYSEEPCQGKMAVMSVKANYEGPPQPDVDDVIREVKEQAGGVMDGVAQRRAADTAVAGKRVGARCDGRTRCNQMTSCAEAMYFLQHCPGVEMDGNRDGVPCEEQWCGRGSVTQQQIDQL